MWQQYNLHMILKGKDTLLEVDEHPFVLRGTIKDGDPVFVIRSNNLSPIFTQPAKM